MNMKSNLLLGICAIALGACATITPTPSKVVLNWKLEAVGTEDNPKTSIALIVNAGKPVAIGTYFGKARESEVNPDNRLIKDAVLASVSTYWAGAGEEIRVVAGADRSLIVQNRWTDEQSGFGKWKVVKTLPVGD
jgi:hypothetical protein